MRIQLTRRGPRDHGAVAIVVAVCVVVLIGMSAIAVDFANAFANKRQLSVAADAAALAAAREISSALPPGAACNANALQPTAQAAAETANTQNDLQGDSVVTAVTVECVDGQVQVTVTNERDVPRILGSVFGQGDYKPARSATAQLYVPAAAAGLRPIAACEDSVLSAYQPNASPPVVNPFLVNINKRSAVCGTAHSGDWGFTNFLDQGDFGTFNTSGSDAFYAETCAGNGNSPNAAAAGGNAPCQGQWLAAGYGGPVWFPNGATVPDTGLAGNTGLAASTFDEIEALVDDIILLPVADRFVDVGSGQERLNLTGIVAVRVCSVKLKGTVTPGTSSECALSREPTSSPDLDTWLSYSQGATQGGIWVIPTNYVTSGVADPSSVCSIANADCDYGTRAVRLFR